MAAGEKLSSLLIRSAMPCLCKVSILIIAILSSFGMLCAFCGENAKSLKLISDNTSFIGLSACIFKGKTPTIRITIKTEMVARMVSRLKKYRMLSVLILQKVSAGTSLKAIAANHVCHYHFRDLI